MLMVAVLIRDSVFAKFMIRKFFTSHA